MSAFGKRGAMMHGAKPAFGVARPMQGDAAPPPTGGLQFPPIDGASLPSAAGDDPFANLPAFDDPIAAERSYLQWRCHSGDSLVMCAIHA